MIHIISKKAIYDYIKTNPRIGEALAAWLSIVEQCNWKTPQDIVLTFGEKAIDLLGKKDHKPSTLSCNRVVFDVKGNHLRVIAKYQFHPLLKRSQLYIKWIGTHADYTKLCKQNLQFEVEMF